MTIPIEILNAYGFPTSEIEILSGGLINTTYAVGDGETPVAVIQRLHPIFAAEVNLDIEAITELLAKKHMPTPLLLRTSDGQPFVRHQDAIWRALTWIDGTCYSKVNSPKIAREGARLVARFHRALTDLDYDFQFVRSGVHDTTSHLRKLRNAINGGSDLENQAMELRDEILAQADGLPGLPTLPRRITHGDLKISNVLFDDQDQGLCLIDLDTMGYETIAYELGDALRSWANPCGEDVESPEICPEIVGAFSEGYAEGAGALLTQPEQNSVILGLEVICLELAARFCVDVFEDRYFGWDEERFDSRAQHNLVRAKGQWALARSVASRRDDLLAIWLRPLL